MKLNQALNKKRPEYAKRHEKLILLYDNTCPHVSEPVKNIHGIRIGSPDIAPSDYHLFRAIKNDLSSQHFKSFEDIEKWIDEWIVSKSSDFYWGGIHLLRERRAKVVASEGQYFEQNILYRKP